MANKKKSAIGSVIAAIVVLILVAFVVSVIFQFTNGMNEDFKTFYIERDGEKVLTSESAAEFEAGKEIRYNINYVFDVVQTKPRDYNVRIVPNAKEDFEFTVDDKLKLWSAESDLSDLFGLKKESTYFTFNVGDYYAITVSDVLKARYPDTELEIPAQVQESGNRYFALVASSYNNRVTIQIDFSGKKMELTEPTAHEITLTGDLGSETSSYVIRYTGPNYSKTGDTVTFSVYMDYAAHFPPAVISEVKVVGVKSEAVIATVNLNGGTFTMPDEAVNIVITCGPVG